MRLVAIAISAAVVLTAIGCEPPPTEQQAYHFTKALTRHFDKLNNQAYERQEDLAKMKLMNERNPGFPKPTGTTFSTYYWDVKVVMVPHPEPEEAAQGIMVPGKDAEGNPLIDQGVIVQDYPCQVEGCGTRLLLTVPGAPYQCPSCGHNPYNENHGPVPDLGTLLKTPYCEMCLGSDVKPKEPTEEQISTDALGRVEGAKVKLMFQLTQSDPNKPLEAIVRYVRRTWHYDERGTVTASEAALQNAGGVGREWLPTADGVDYSKPGYHRLDSTFVGEIAFVFEGGQLVQKAPARETAIKPWKDIKIPQ